MDQFFEQLHGWVNAINDPMWSGLVYMLLGAGLFFTITTGFVQFRLFGRSIKEMLGGRKQGDDPHGITPFQAFVTGLASRVGVGNIAGVAIAIKLGGPGAVFWMWITAIFGMATKYGEGVLAVKYRVTNSKGEMSGGPMYYIENGLGKKWKWLAFLFAFFGVMASFGIGSTVQANSVAQAVHSSFGIDTWITGVVLTLITAFVVLGGIQSIARVSSVVVPFMAVLYIVGGLVVVAMHFDLLLPALKVIMHDAFTGQAVAGGVVGTVIRYGVARGVFSNEAGMGSAPIAAAAAKTDHPVRQALVSMTGTFLDTIIVCSITGIVLVMGILQSNGGAFAVPTLKGAALTTATFDAMLSGYGGWVVTIGLIFFAYSTTLGWCYYGEKCATYVFGDKSVPMYRVIYVATVMLGTVLSMDMVWAAADTFNGLMAVPNLIALLLLSKVIVQETRDFKAKRASGELDY